MGIIGFAGIRGTGGSGGAGPTSTMFRAVIRQGGPNPGPSRGEDEQKTSRRSLGQGPIRPEGVAGAYLATRKTRGGRPRTNRATAGTVTETAVSGGRPRAARSVHR